MTLLLSFLLAGRWAVAVVAADPNDTDLAQNLSGVLEAQVTELSGASVVASEELRAKLGLQGRGILGCVGEAPCLQKAGSALGIDRLIVVIVSRGVGDEYVLDMKLVDVQSGSFTSSDLKHPKGVEALIHDAREVVDGFVHGRKPAAVTEVPPPAQPVPAAEAAPRRWLPLTVGGAGIALVATGAILALSVGGDYDNLKKTCAPSCPESSYSSLRTRQQVGDVLIIVGAAAAAGGAVWYFLSPSAPSSRRAWLAPAPNGLVIGGAF